MPVVILGQLLRKNVPFLFISCHLKYCWISFLILYHTRDSFKLMKFLMNTCSICHNHCCFHPRLHPPKTPVKAVLLESLHLCGKGIVLGGKRQWRAHKIALKGWFTSAFNYVLSPLFESSSGNRVQKWLFGNVIFLRYVDPWDSQSAADFSTFFLAVSIYDFTWSIP